MRTVITGRPGVEKFPRTWTDARGVVWVQVVEAAARLGVTRGRVYQIMSTKRFRARERDGIRYVRERDVVRYKLYQRELTHIGKLREAVATG